MTLGDSIVASVLFSFLFGTMVYAPAPLDKIAVVHSFTRGADGTDPAGPLIQLPNGNFAGMTFGIGNNVGKPATVFTMTPAGNVTTLYTFAAVAFRIQRKPLLTSNEAEFFRRLQQQCECLKELTKGTEVFG